MPTERNRFDLPRGYDYYGDQLQRGPRALDRIAATRDDEQVFRANEDRRQQSPFLRHIALTALISSSIALIGKKYGSTDIARKIMGKLGAMADTVRQKSIQGTYMSMAEYLKATGYQDRTVEALLRASKEDIPQIRHLEIVEAVKDISRAYQVLKTPGAVQPADSFFQQFVEINKRRISERFAAGSRSIGEIQDLTVRHIQDMSTNLRKELFGEAQWETLKYGLEKGFVTPDAIVGSGIFFNAAKAGTKASVLNTRMFSFKAVARGAEALANQFQVPLLGIKFGDIVSAPIKHVFGKGAFAGVVKHPAGQGRAFIVGGEAYELGIKGGAQELRYLGEGYKLGPRGVMGEAGAARAGQLRTQQYSTYSADIVDPIYRRQHPFKAAMKSVSELLGIGPQYRTQEAVGKVLFYDMPRRRLYGAPQAKETISYGAAGFHERLAKQVADDLGIDVATGKKIPFLESLKEYQPRITKPGDYGSLSAIEKIKALFGAESKVVFLEPGAIDIAGRPTTRKIIAASPGAGAVRYGGRGLLPGEQYVDELGQAVIRAPLTHFAYKKGASAVLDVAHYMTTRLNTLIGATAGIGFRPTSGTLGFAGNLAKIYGIYAGFNIGLESLGYANYLLGGQFGYSPKDLALDTYAAGARFVQQIREMSGFAPAARYTEDIMPGVTTSMLSNIVRTVGPPAIGLYNKSLKGVIAGAAVSAFVGELPFPGISKTPEETSKILSGEKLVPIRGGRYWLLGKQPYEGGKISYYAPSWFARMKSEYKFTDSLYGSQAEYFRYISSLPTPTNLFGLLHSKSHLARKHLLSRPYPDSSASGDSGMMVDPTRSLYGAYGPPMHAAQALGYTPIAPAVQPVKPTFAGDVESRISQLTEMSGIYKFVLWNLTGAKDMFSDYKATASYRFMNSPSRAFFDEQMGGLFGMSELWRRFVTWDEVARQRSATNNMSNQMPDWLPGIRSNFMGQDNKWNRFASPGDKNYHIDFSVGDPYCVSGATLVDTSAGLKEANLVREGDTVKNSDGEWTRIKRIVVRSLRANERSVRVSVKGLSAFPSVFSQGHPIMVLRPTGQGKVPQKEWVHAGNLGSGDRLLYPLPNNKINMVHLGPYLEDFTQTHSWIYLHADEESAAIIEYLEVNSGELAWGERKKILNTHGWSPRKYEVAQAALKRHAHKRIPCSIRIDEDIAYLLGIYAAEGYGNVDRCTIGFALHEREDSIRRRIDLACQKLFGKTPTWYPQEGLGGQYIMGHKIAAALLPRLLGLGAANKILPTWALELPECETIALIKGLIDGDGCYFTSNARHRVGFTTVSRDLAYQLWELLLKVGFRATVSSWTPPAGSISKQKSYAVNVNGKRGLALAVLLGYVDGPPPDLERQRTERFRDGYAILQVESVETDSEVIVYGFEVEEGETFCVAGYVTHNSKIPHGELRLPGPARETIARLHSGTPGIYDAIDRFLILADVAPGSNAYKHYQVLVNAWLKAGVIDDYWAQKIGTTKEQVKSKMQRYQIYYRRFKGIDLPYKMVEPDIKYNIAEQAIGGAWETFTHDVVSRAGVAVPVLGPLLSNKLLAQRDPLEQYLKTEVYDTDEYDWAKPWATMVRPMFSQLTATDPFTATAGGGITGFMFGANPMAKLILGTAGAAFFGGASTTRGIITGQMTGGYVPGYVRGRRELEEYFDYLKYVKYRRLELQSNILGRRDLQEHFSDMRARTVASLDYSLPAWEFNNAVMRALPPRERNFYQDLIGTPEEQREEVLQYVPEYLKTVYQAAWAKAGDARFTYKDLQKDPDRRAAEYFSQHKLPGREWAGWHPEVNMNYVKVKTVDSMSNSVAADYHRFNLFDSTRIETQRQFPGIDLDVSGFFKSRPGVRQDVKQIFEAELVAAGILDVTINNDLGNGLENVVNWNMTQDKTSQFFALANDILRG